MSHDAQAAPQEPAQGRRGEEKPNPTGQSTRGSGQRRLRGLRCGAEQLLVTRTMENPRVARLFVQHGSAQAALLCCPAHQAPPTHTQMSPPG